MTLYEVSVAPHASDRIAEYGNFIADQSGSVELARRWMAKVYSQIRSLSYFPQRHSFAEENQFRDYEIRCQIIGNYLALYTIDQERNEVQVLSFRHGRQLPSAEGLPSKDSD